MAWGGSEAWGAAEDESGAGMDGCDWPWVHSVNALITSGLMRGVFEGLGGGLAETRTVP